MKDNRISGKERLEHIPHTIRVEKARYVDGFRIEIEFNDKTRKIIDFGPFLMSHPHPAHDKYREIDHFKQFKVEDGNILWGKNWDLIFPVIQLYKGKIKL